MSIHVHLCDAARGRWRDILIEVGLPPKFLANKHGPCPFCGGKDRFRFDNKNGEGTFYCSQCGAGDGAELVKRFLGCDFKEAARRIEPLIGQARLQTAKKPMPATKVRDQLKALWRASQPICDGDLASLYLASRGCWPLPFATPALRFAPAVRHTESGRDWPCLLSVVCDAEGKPATLHRTWIAEDGSSKAPVDPPRATMPGEMPKGFAVRLGRVAAKIGIAEGVETALSAALMSEHPVWSVLSTTGMRNFEPPADVQELVIFADNDLNFSGQAAAYALANRLSGRVKVSIAMPGMAGQDFNDVLLQRRTAA